MTPAGCHSRPQSWAVCLPDWYGAGEHCSKRLDTSWCSPVDLMRCTHNGEIQVKGEKAALDPELEKLLKGIDHAELRVGWCLGRLAAARHADRRLEAVRRVSDPSLPAHDTAHRFHWRNGVRGWTADSCASGNAPAARPAAGRRCWRACFAGTVRSPSSWKRCTAWQPAWCP